MKKFLILVIAALGMSAGASAQSHTQSRYYNPNTGRMDYSHHSNRYGTSMGETYYGFRIGPSFSTVNSDDPKLDGGNSQTGLNIGVVVGVPLSNHVPLYVETGLTYNEKGGRKKLSSGKKMTYDLNYLEIPITLKYIYDIDDHFSIQPLFGGYLACGVGGKMKNYEERAAFNSFSDDAFQRFDGGLRIGCGIAYDLFYADLSYDIGLANICHDTFDTSHNGCFMLNFGVNF